MTVLVSPKCRLLYTRDFEFNRNQVPIMTPGRFLDFVHPTFAEAFVRLNPSWKLSGQEEVGATDKWHLLESRG